MEQQEEPLVVFVKDYQLIRVTFLSDSQKSERLQRGFVQSSAYSGHTWAAEAGALGMWRMRWV